MHELIAQAGGLDAQWIIGGLASAFCAFAVWVGKFMKQIWSDVKLIWVEFKDMHDESNKTLEDVIKKQEASNEKSHDRTTKILSKSLEIERHVAETKYSIMGFRDEIEGIKEKIIQLEDTYERIKTIDIDNHDVATEQLRD